MIDWNNLDSKWPLGIRFDLWLPSLAATPTPRPQVWWMMNQGLVVNQPLDRRTATITLSVSNALEWKEIQWRPLTLTRQRSNRNENSKLYILLLFLSSFLSSFWWLFLSETAVLPFSSALSSLRLALHTSTHLTRLLWFPHATESRNASCIEQLTY